MKYQFGLFGDKSFRIKDAKDKIKVPYNMTEVHTQNVITT